MFEGLASGLLVSLDPVNIIFSLLGVVLGVVIGSIPGLGPGMAIAITVPITFGMSAATGMLLLMGIFCGAVYGGSISAILLGVPGTPASIVTVWDGFKMTKSGRASTALSSAIVASTIGGLLSAFALLFLSPLLAKVTLLFGPPEYAALALWGLAIVCSLESKSLAKGLMAAFLGLILATVGMSPVTGAQRFTFGMLSLSSGLEIIPVLIGVFCIPEVMSMVNYDFVHEVIIKTEKSLRKRLESMIQFFKAFKPAIPTSLRSGIIGVIIGIIPGAGGTIAPFITYTDAKNRSKKPEEFGTGIIEGIAAAESANNGASASSLIPLLTLGIPGSAAAAVFLGALTIHGLQPGVMLFQNNPDVIYGLLSGTIFIQIYMLVIGLVFAPYIAKATLIPNSILAPVIIVFCCIGAYASGSNLFNVWVMIIFGFIGYAMKYFGLSPAAMVLGMILGPMLENNISRSLAISYGSPLIFVKRPISLGLYVLTIYMLFGPLSKSLENTRKKD